MKYTTIDYKVEASIATIKLNRPDSLNAVTNPMIQELREIAYAIALDDNIRCVIITGAGRAFCAGGDMSEIKTSYGGNAGFIQHMDFVSSMITALVDIPKPVIAAVNGAAVGAGMNIALTADYIIASDRAKFSQVFTNIGLVTDMGGAYFLPRLVGVRKAKELILEAKMIKADEALSLGIVNKVVTPDELDSAVMELAQRLAKGPTVAYGLAKKMINLSFESSLKTVLDYEGGYQSICGGTSDYKEGVNAFLEKRTPNYQNK